MAMVDGVAHPNALAASVAGDPFFAAEARLRRNAKKAMEWIDELQRAGIISPEKAALAHELRRTEVIRMMIEVHAPPKKEA